MDVAALVESSGAVLFGLAFISCFIAATLLLTARAEER
jgi:hypothetical protein